jgi:hypothetical protein
MGQARRWSRPDRLVAVWAPASILRRTPPPPFSSSVLPSSPISLPPSPNAPTTSLIRLSPLSSSHWRWPGSSQCNRDQRRMVESWSWRTQLLLDSSLAERIILTAASSSDYPAFYHLCRYSLPGFR